MSTFRAIFISLSLLLLAGRPAESAQEVVLAMAGTWQGAVISGATADASPGSELSLTITLERKGFAVTLNSDSQEIFRARLPETTRKGVYATDEARGLLGLFSRRDTSNPLEGEPLSWARSDRDMLVAYNFLLGRGAYRLDRLELVPVGQAIELRFSRHGHGLEPQTILARLSRKEG